MVASSLLMVATPVLNSSSMRSLHHIANAGDSHRANSIATSLCIQQPTPFSTLTKSEPLRFRKADNVVINYSVDLFRNQ